MMFNPRENKIRAVICMCQAASGEPVKSVYILIVAISTLAACDAESQSHEMHEDRSERSIWDGTPEGLAVIDFLNDPSTTMAMLDDEVRLDKRAAGNLIAHRDGGDREPGTTDDDLYNDIIEVDDVRWVGPASIQRLVDYVLSIGVVPTGDDHLGTWDDVRFTVTEAELTVSYVNSASLALLDDELQLDSRAASAIIDAQPVESVEHLSELYYVGKSALSILKEEATYSEQ
jgi:hypothetical protein